METLKPIIYLELETESGNVNQTNSDCQSRAFQKEYLRLKRDGQED